jgi:Uma2 family endonuclease
MSTSTTLMTAEELIRLPRGRFRYELIDGELKTMSPSGHPHGRIIMCIAAPLAQFVWDHELGEVYGAETGFKLTANPDTVLAPDAAFINKERFDQGRDTKGYWLGAPDLAVEVLSPSESAADVEGKVSKWLRYGAKQVWVVIPERCTITIHRSATDVITFSEGDYLKADDLLPGFSVPLEKIFRV